MKITTHDGEIRPSILTGIFFASLLGLAALDQYEAKHPSASQKTPQPQMIAHASSLGLNR